MQTEESRNDLGAVRIHKNVVASIASLAVLDIEGVKRVGGDLKSGLLELIGRKSDSAIRVEFTKSDEVKVDIPIVIKYGYHIPDVAGRAQESVRSALEKMTSLSIRDININVQAIERG
jgi:uncharacterized alkaline shock family protein YloU